MKHICLIYFTVMSQTPCQNSFLWLFWLVTNWLGDCNIAKNQLVGFSGSSAPIVLEQAGLSLNAMISVFVGVEVWHVHFST